MVAVKIPGAESIDTIAPARDPGVRATPEDFGAQIGASAAHLGDTAMGAGATLVSLSEHLKAKRQAAEDDTYYQAYNVNVAPRIEQEELATRKAYPDGGPDYIAASQAARQNAHLGTINDLAARGITPSDAARRRVETNFAGRDMNGRVGAVTYDNNSQVDKLKSVAVDNATGTASQVAAGSITLDKGIEQIGEIVKSASTIYSGKEMRAFEDTAKKTVVDAEIERLTRTGLVEEAAKVRDKWYGHTTAKGEGNAGAVATVAENLGIKPRDLAAVISYETGGKMDPGQWGGKGSNYLGLIQFGPEERAKYGVRAGMTFAEQMPAVEAYLKDRGVKPGMGVAQIYSIVNAGSLDNNGQPRWDRSDGNGTIADHVSRIQRDHYVAADKFLAGVAKGEGNEGALLPDPVKSLAWQKQFEAQRTDMVRADAIRKAQDDKISKSAESEYLKDIFSEAPKATVRGIMNDDRLSNPAKLQLKAVIDKELGDEPLTKTSAVATQDLVDRMRLPEGDPRKISSTGPIYDAYTKDKKLTKADFTFALKQFADGAGDDLTPLGKQRTAFVKNAGDAISLANIGSSMTGGAGTFQKYNFEQHVARVEADYRAEKKNPANLYNPVHPDYLGKLDNTGRPAILKPFLTSMQKDMHEEASTIAPTTTASVPDSAASRAKLDEWLRQRGGFQVPASAPSLPVSQ